MPQVLQTMKKFITLRNKRHTVNQFYLESIYRILNPVEIYLTFMSDGHQALVPVKIFQGANNTPGGYYSSKHIARTPLLKDFKAPILS